MDAHSKEYAAAIAGMADHTPAPIWPERGDEVSGVTDGWAWGGTVRCVMGDIVIVEALGLYDEHPLADIVAIRKGAK